MEMHSTCNRQHADNAQDLHKTVDIHMLIIYAVPALCYGTYCICLLLNIISHPNTNCPVKAFNVV